MANDVVVCCIAKDEELYIDEWIRHNFKLGFKHIYVYDNSEENSLEKLPMRYENKITVIHMPGRVKQIPAYNHFKDTYGKNHKWCAFIDVDEFIMMRYHIDIHDLLMDHCERGALCLNWYLFGSSGENDYRDRPVTERFQMRGSRLNRHVKVIVRLEDLVRVNNPHSVELKKGVYQHDTNDKRVDGIFNENGTDDVACIHHYFLKSREEFRKKAQRGRADIAEHRDFDKDFAGHDVNEVHDSRAYEFNR